MNKNENNVYFDVDGTLVLNTMGVSENTISILDPYENKKVFRDKHNPGEEMHHAREKSTDHGDCILRHLIDAEDLLAALSRAETQVTPQDVLNEVNQMAWRALAFSQLVHEKFGAPLAPGAKSIAEIGKGK